MLNDHTKNVLIIGGGVAGMSAAKVIAGHSVNVHLVEKSEYLGGHASQWACMATLQCQYCGACLSHDLVREIEELKNITLYKGCMVDSIQNLDGSYRAHIKGCIEKELFVDAICLATGFTPFDPGRLTSFEYQAKGVITTAELSRIIKNETLMEAVHNKPSPSIAFIQCVGSRNRELGADYCSQVCCKTAVRFANKITFMIPDASVTIFHMDLQTCGKMFRTQVTGPGKGVNFVQGIPGKILPIEHDRLRLFQEDKDTGARQASDFDMVVLAIGMQQGETQVQAINLGLEPDRWGFISQDGSDRKERIYAAGAVKGPMDIISAIEQGISAAHDCLKDMGVTSVHSDRPIAVLGGGDEGRIVSKALNSSGHKVYLFEKENTLLAPDGVTLFPESCITGISGGAGDYIIMAKSGNSPVQTRVSAIVAATGADKIELSDEKGICASGQIISLDAFRLRAASEIINSRKNIVFWLDHSAPESKVNSRHTLLSAIEAKEAGANVTVMMEKMLVHDIDGQMLYDSARHKGIKFLRAQTPSDVSIAEINGSINIKINEATLSGVTIDMPCDLLVIPEELKAAEANNRLSGMLQQEMDKEGFLQSPNPRHRRVQSTRRGIFYAGSCHDDISRNDLVHEIRTINALINLMPQDESVSQAYAVIDTGKCGKCLTCLRICPHAAVMLDEHSPCISASACLACGLCVTSCPASAISIMGSEADGAGLSDFSGAVVFACKRSLAIANNSPDKMNGDLNGCKIIPIDCACSLDPRLVIDYFAAGAERIMVMSCHPDNCVSIHGNSSAGKKAERIFKDTGISRSMLSVHAIAANEPVRLKHLIKGALSQEDISDE
ncbi:MAG: FAD-dependent oxidoreductase [Deltaproteobacteria bacterium]|nr:FAD-dependent oxidoreductase [Deltaproteobacteria bacterium]